MAGAPKRDLCTRLGSDVVIDRTTQSVPDAVLDATDGRGVDVVFDPVGGAAAGAALRCLSSGGRLLAVGFASGRWVDADISQLVRRSASVVGVYAGGLTRSELAADHEALLALAAEGRLEGATTAVQFDSLPDALAAVDRGEAVGKFVVRRGDADRFVERRSWTPAVAYDEGLAERIRDLTADRSDLSERKNVRRAVLARLIPLEVTVTP